MYLNRLVAIHEVLALTEAVQEHRHGANVETMRPEPHQVIQDPRDFVEHDPNVLGTHRNLDAEHFLYRHHVGVLIAHHRHVVETIHVTNTLIEWLAFGELLGGAMQQADVRIRLLNHLTLDLEDETQNAVRRRVLRAEVHCVTLNLSHRSHP